MLVRSRIIISLFAFLFCSFGITQGVYAFATPQSFAPLVKAHRSKVVHISTSSIIKQRGRKSFQGRGRDPFLDRFFPNLPKKRKQSALGSGFIISSDGYIVTNNHVVAKADKIEVTLFDERSFKATVIGRDPRTDLALIKIDAKGLPFVTFGDSAKLEVGDWVMAIGNPHGLDHTVTVGILSAKGRDIFGGTAYGQFLQTDAAINPGNSGGPLFDVKGRVIGINTAIVAGGQGLGFAVPINIAKSVIQQLRTKGRVERGWFGVGIQNVNSALAKSFGLPKRMRGVLITDVRRDGPAFLGGLKQGDIVVQYNGKKLNKTTDLQRAVAETKPGKKIRVKIFRNKKFLYKTVTVGLAPTRGARGEIRIVNRYGFELSAITREVRQKYRIQAKEGLLIVRIKRDKTAWDAGLRKGDVIIKVNNKKVKTTRDFYSILDRFGKDDAVSLLVKRKGRSLYFALPVKPK